MAQDTLDNSLVGTLERLASAFGTNLFATQSGPHEEVITTYTKGSGRFDANKEFITLSMFQYKLNGEQCGHHEGVWQRNFQSPAELLNRPPNPPEPLNEPRGPVPHQQPIAYTKGIWVFDDDSSITAVGPALSHLMPLRDGSFLFAVTCAQVIVEGTGRFRGARGLKSSLGSTLVKGNLFDPSNDEPFTAVTIDTFRVVRGEYVR